MILSVLPSLPQNDHLTPPKKKRQKIFNPPPKKNDNI